MTLPHHVWDRLRAWAILLGSFLVLMWLASMLGCTPREKLPQDAVTSAGGTLRDGVRDAVEVLGSDPTQGEVAAYAIYPVLATSSLLLLGGVVMWFLGSPRKALQSIVLGIGLTVATGAVLTLLKREWAVWTILGLSVVGGLLYLFRETWWAGRQVDRIARGEASGSPVLQRLLRPRSSPSSASASSASPPSSG